MVVRRYRRSCLSRIGQRLVLLALVPWSVRAAAATHLPVPCVVAASCGGKAAGFVTSGAATAVQSGSTLTVAQTSANATLNWASFNISADGKVVFNQPTAASIALNRIFDANPSSIFGALSANGQIYLINANGFVFGSTSTVNVAGLIASSLNITDATFATGILAPLQGGNPALQAFTDSSGNPIVNTGSIVVQKGAELTAADQGRLLLAAPSVQNSGNLTAPDGQVVLAAGQSVYLQASDDPSLRGLIVEVDGTGSASNQLTGAISAARGNVTLVGLAVNQDGRVSATTSVAANGSITLEAANGATPPGVGTISAQQGGTLEMGPSSVTEVLPELTDTTTAVPAQTQLQSTINLTGQQVLMHGGTIDAPSGALNVAAAANPSIGVSTGGNPLAEIRIDAGTTIDLAGSNAVLPMAANLVTVQLRSNEFADDPTQRNGALYQQTVTVDVRADGGAGTPIADVSSAIAAVGQTIAQRTEAGGTASFLSEGDVVFNPGASINVSGGATTYLGGTIQTTALVGANGQLYDIGSASSLQTYVGVVNPTFTVTNDKWGVQEVVPTPGLSHYESTYSQGAAAGSVEFGAPTMVLQGKLQASAVDGPYQRGPVGTAVGDSVPGGTLVIGDAGGAANNPTTIGQVDYLAPAVSISASETTVVVADGTPLPLQSLQLPVAYLTSDGFSTTQIYSNTSVTLPAGLPLTLPAGASLLVDAPRVDVDSNITALGGSLSFASVLTIDTQNQNDPQLGAGEPRLGVAIGNGVTLDVNGQWTNDSPIGGGNSTGATFQNGGSIKLQLTQPGGEIVLGDDVALLANGGAWLSAAGSLTDGSGGAITLDASPAQSALQFGQNLGLAAYGTGTASGGSFALSAPRIAVLQGSGSAWTTAQSVDELNAPGGTLALYAPLFDAEGFSAVSLTATGAVVSTVSDDVLTIAAGTTISVQTLSRQLNPGFENAVTGGTIDGFAETLLLPLYERPATTVSLNVLREADDFPLGEAPFGAIDVQAGAAILGDPDSTINLTGEGDINVAGTLRAPGGTVNLQLLSPQTYDSATDVTYDAGYLANLGITIGSTAVIDVGGGAAILTPNTQGLALGTVLPGGSVTLNAERGTVAAAAGSVIDFEGTSASLDVAKSGPSSGYLSEVVASAGGSLTVASVESLSLLGTLDGKAGVGNSGAAAAGSLTVDLTRSEIILNQPQTSGVPMELELVGSTAGSSTAAPNLAPNFAQLGLAQILSSGIDSLTLSAGGATAGEILFDTSQPLNLARQITLNTQTLSVANGVNANIAAPFVEIGNPSIGTTATAPTAVGGAGTLMVAAEQMILQGGFAIDGTANVSLTSQGDVQLQGTASATGPETGQLNLAGNLTIDAARVYPDTYTVYGITAVAPDVGAPATITLGQTTASLGAPLSGGGSVALTADNLVIGGTLLAPFGTIALTANDALTLSNGSLVSVSGAGLTVPYGQTQEDGAQWVYDTPGAINPITGVPTKQVSLTAPNITVDAKATVNLTGGGDLYAYEWVPGTGGTTDALTSSPSVAGYISGLYAIIPTAAGQAAPYDPEESGSLGPTQTVYLSGGAGIAVGVYALLPARYALEPGAILIQAESSYTSATGGQIGALANGIPVLAGYLSSGSTGLHTGLTDYEGFAIYPSGYGQKLAAYTINAASTYFSEQASSAGTGAVPLPADAGTLTLEVAQAATVAITNSLDLQGSVLTAAASGGRGATVNISAPDLEITGGTGTAAAGSIAVSGSVLQGWGASSLTLGGIATPTTTITAAGTSTSVTTGTVAVAADSVTVDSGVQLSADQILLVAQQAIDVNSGASLASTSGKNGTVVKPNPSLVTLSLTDADGNALPQGALLGVSDLGLPVVARSGSVTGASIAVESGATIASGGALAFDAPGAVTLAGTLNGKGASWSLSSDSIAFVGATPSSDSLNIGANVLAALQQAAAVRVASAGNIDIFSPVALGASSASAAPGLNALSLIATAVNNEAVGNSLFGAENLSIAGNGTTPGAAPAAGTGTLSLVADTLNLGPGSVALTGFAHAVAQVAGALQTSGTGALAVSGDLTVNAVELNPGAGSNSAISASGDLSIGAPTAAAAGSKPVTQVGGALALTATSIEDAGAILAPSGIVSLTSTGGAIAVAGTARISTAGTVLTAADQTAASPGGTVSLTAQGGVGVPANVSLSAGSTISVAGQGIAPAGSLSITGAGTVTLAGSLVGTAGTGGVGGSFSLDAGQLNGGLTPLAASLAAGGYTDAIDVRVQSGNLDLAAGSSLRANQVTLTADSGAVNIAGVIDAASAAQRGLIDLSGGTGVTLAATGQLHADGTGASGLGGEIDINSTCAACSITLDPGSVISANGAAQMGELILRAPVSGASDVAINLGGQGIGADVSEAGQVIIEPVMVFQTTAASVNSDLANDATTAANYVAANGAAIAARLASPSATPISVQAGVELQDANAGDTLNFQSYDLSQFSANGPGASEVVNLTVRAAGAIQISGAISDGFIDDADTGIIALSSAPSGSLSFVAGADVTSANPLATLANSAADLTLMTSSQKPDGTTDGIGPAVVRTGTGDIDLVAAGDVVFQKGTSAYTGGMAVPGSGNFETGQAGPVTLSGPSNSTLLLNFGMDGGNLRVVAGGDVSAQPVSGDNGNYSVTGWQLRQGNAENPSQYGVNYAGFDWNLGALAGGDLTVVAGGNIANLSAATADTLVAGANSVSGNATLYGAGGGLSLTAGGDIGSAQVYVASGVGTLVAGGGLTALQTVAINDQSVGSSLALGNAQIDVWTRQSIQVDAIYNPTSLPQEQGSSADVTGAYWTYGANSQVALSSTAGTVTLGIDTINLTMSALLGSKVVSDAGENPLVLPPSLSVLALQGNIDITTNGPSAVLFPSSTGQLTLFAGEDIVAVGGFTMADNLPGNYPTAAAPQIQGSLAANDIAGFAAFQGDIHVGDPNPALVTAGQDIDDLYLSVPKAADLVAGRDINNLEYYGQNTSASDITLIAAGRDLIDTTAGGNLGAIQLGGEGSLDVLTGRNLNLGFGNGITTIGNIADPNLPTATGADVNVFVGYGTQGADIANFLQTIVANPATADDATYESQLIAYVESLTGSTGLTFTQAEKQFLALTTAQQSALIDADFFNELLLSGRAANNGTGVGFTEGYAAIAALFPTSAANPTPYAGDLTMTESQIYTLSGGNINVLVPGGQLNVGLANPPATVVAKAPSSLGIVAEGSGNVDIYSEGDVNVNESRIFTLGGGNILIWSNKGSIDAGNGSKSSLSVPPPVVLVSASGTISLDFAGTLSSGSGIRTIQTDPGVAAGDVDLDAPVGTVNAGDAGIGAAGNINIAAAHVLGVANINFGGTATGVPTDLSNLASSLSGVSAASTGSTNSATAAVSAAAAAATKEVAPLAQNALSWLEVFVTGLGEDDCKPEDLECLRRQKTANP